MTSYKPLGFSALGFSFQLQSGLTGMAAVAPYMHLMHFTPQCFHQGIQTSQAAGKLMLVASSQSWFPGCPDLRTC